MNWSESNDFCHLTGGRLVSMEDGVFLNVLSFITQEKIFSDSWLGGFEKKNVSWSWSELSPINLSDLFWELT